MANLFKIRSIFWLLSIVALIGVSSCKTTRVAVNSKSQAIRPMGINKLIKNVENNAFDSKYLSIKRISCLFDNGKSKTTFKASIAAENGKQIVLMLNKMNIPIARIWLTPDSIKFINYIEKDYYIGDYGYISSILGKDIDFDLANAIVFNNLVAIKDDKRDLDAHVKIDSGMYIIDSVEKAKTKQETTRKTRKIQANTLVKQTVFIDSETFKIKRLKLDDTENAQQLDLVFSEYAPVGKYLYPGDLLFNLISPQNTMSINLKFAGISTEKEKSIRFKVPEKYNRINN